LNNLTDYFLAKLFPPIEQIMYSPSTSFKTNNVIWKSVVIYGKPGSGKTELVRSLVERAVQKYGQENVNANMTQLGNLALLMKYGLNAQLVQILFADNITLVKPKKEVIKNFYCLRHYYQMLTGKNHGLIIAILAAHRFHSVNVNLRDADFLIARNSPTSPWDNSIMKRYLGQEGINLLEILEEERMKNRKLWKFSVFYTKRKQGVLELPLATENFLNELDTYKYIESSKKKEVKLRGILNGLVSPSIAGLRL